MTNRNRSLLKLSSVLWVPSLIAALMMGLFVEPSLSSEIESPELTPQGEFTLEINTTVEREENRDEDVTILSAPQPTLYIGILPNFEFQLEGDGMIITDPDGADSTTSASDFSMKGKVGLTSEDEWVPLSAAFVVISFPTGDDAVTSDGVDSTFSYLASWNLPHDLNLAINVGFASLTNGLPESKRFFEYSTVLNLGFPIFGKLTGFTEYFNNINNENQPDTHSMDVGLGFEVSEYISTEFTGGAGLNEAAADYFFSFQIGFSFR